MAEQLALRLAAEFPDYIEFSNILDLSELTWQRYGLSADKLMSMDEWSLKMLLIKLKV